ncbi:MAG: hypothetical protein IID42_01560 [Planctomycetes bacterium]|nr:hypothetical protein [Planctomycetota bacterium]
MARITIAGTDAVLMSVCRTLKLRGRSPTKTIAGALQAYVTTGYLPKLPESIVADG